MRRVTKEVDCVVIGAGNGGLVAGVTLAKNGVRTLMLEQHNSPGGFASSFTRGRYEFEVALHEIGGIGEPDNPGDIRKMFEERLGVKMDWHHVPEAHRIITKDGVNPDLDGMMPFGIDNYVRKVEEMLPGSKPKLLRLLALCKEVIDAINWLRDQQGKELDLGYLIEHFSNFIKTAGYSVDDVYKAMEIPIDLQRVLNAYWGYVGTETSRMGFSIYGLMMYTLIEEGAYVPDHFSHFYTSMLERNFRKLGGELWYNTRVEKIIMKDGKPEGVLTNHGDFIKTDKIVSNASPLLVYNQLIEPKSEVPPAAYKNINARKPGFSCFVVYLGLDKTAEELGIKAYSTMMFTTTTTDQAYHSYEKLDVSEQPNGICLSNVYPGAAPEGGSVLAFCFLQAPDAWKDVKPEEYFDVKNRIARGTIETYERLANVKIQDAIEEIAVATPVTMARFTGGYNGYVYSFEQEPWDSLIARMMTFQDEKYLKGIEMAGGFSMFVHGYQFSLMSGEFAAQAIIGQLKEEGRL